MIRSMTGFATKSLIITIRESKTPLTINIKSLNSRYFDANCKLSYPLASLETDFIRLFKTKLIRGAITFTIHIANPNAFKGAIEPSTATIKSYLTALDTIKKTFSIEGTLSIANVLLLPNIFITEEQELDEQSKKNIFEATDGLIIELISMQTKEGQALKKDIIERMAIIDKEIKAIEIAFEMVMTSQKQKVNEALTGLEKDTSKFAEMQKDALYAILDKIDVHEEIVRFKNHLKNLLANLESAEIEKGKRIDFILQELSREINTITAKCSDATISSHAINIKVELEKAREQTQNIV
jgi:uncharacterized protein (TIGR00255 family)